LRTRTKWPSIFLLVACEAMALALWFSATAIIPVLRLEFSIDDTRASLFSSIVAVGYVAGTLSSAFLGLADRLHPRRFFMASALAAAGSNFAILFFEPTSWWIVFFRFITGACMAGLYPVGMKMASTWAKGDTGLLIGALVSALTLGAAMPHLLNAIGGLDWRFTLIAAAILAVVAGALINFVGLGPSYGEVPPFNPAAVTRAWTDKAIRFANADLMRSLLVVVDGLQRSLDAAANSSNLQAVFDGVRLVYDDLMKALGAHGLEPIEAHRKPFDPNVHEALMQQPSADAPAGTVLEEIARGYRLRERVLRPAKVVVAQEMAPSDGAPSPA